MRRARMPVAHFDLYRLNAASEIEELGLDLALKRGIALIEWPERASGTAPGEPSRNSAGGRERRQRPRGERDAARIAHGRRRLGRAPAAARRHADADGGRRPGKRSEPARLPAGRRLRAPLCSHHARTRRRRDPDGLGAPARRPRDPQRPALQPHRASRRGRAPVRSSGRCAPRPWPKRAGNLCAGPRSRLSAHRGSGRPRVRPRG